MVGKHLKILLGLALLWIFSGAGAAVFADELPIRLVTMIDHDDHGDPIKFPQLLYYDYWASETYLLCSTGRIVVYDQKYFPVVSFGSGRGLRFPVGMTVDKHGMVYVCLESNGGKGTGRLLVYNQALFLSKTIVYDDIPELVGFVATRVAVSESGEIYLAGHLQATSTWVVVLSPEGKFLRFLNPPTNDAWHPAPPKTVPAAGAAVAPPPGGGEEQDGERISVALKPKKAPKGDDEDKGTMGPAQITDVKIDRQGRIYLLSREVSYIYVFNSKDEFLFRFGEKGGSSGKLSNPVSLGVDLERRVIYVCDYMRHTILCYDYDSGKFIFEFGGRGDGPLWFDFPNNVEVDQRGRVMVSDLFNSRVQVIDTNMGERRPLAGGLGTLAAGRRPEAAAPSPVADVSALAPSSSPPEQGLAVAPAGAMLPAAVLAPKPPPVMAGMAAPSLRVTSVGMNAPPVGRRAALPPRELAPLRLKKIAAPAGPDLAVAVVAPLRSPARMLRPGAVRFAQEQEAARRGLVGDAPSGILAHFRALPAAVGVYGPVAALVGVGSWLLYTNR